MDRWRGVRIRQPLFVAVTGSVASRVPPTGVEGAIPVKYYQRHIGDYIRDTAHLSLLEHGIYSRLLDLYYSRECPLPVDAVDRLVGVRTPAEKKALENVLHEFFENDDGNGWRNRRADLEIAKAADFMAKAKESGKHGASKRWGKGKDSQPHRDPIATPPIPHKGSDRVEVATNTNTKNSEVLRTSGAEPPQPPDGGEPPTNPADPRKALWDIGVSVLGSDGRSLIGKAIKRVGEPKVAEVLGHMAAKPMADPKAFFSKATTPAERKFVC